MADWIFCAERRPAARLALVCFPYAGGSAQTYRRWPSLLPQDLEVHTAHLPGRFPRHAEAPLTSIAGLVDALAPELLRLKKALNKPLVLFGHSMGAIVAFESARALARAGEAPVHLAVSARSAPHLKPRRRELHPLADADFIFELAKMDGTPAEVLADADLMAAVLPTLRADFTAIEQYRPFALEPLGCMISVFGGKNDPDVPLEALLAWQDYTRGQALVELCPGGHFFIDDGPAPMLKTLARDLAHY